MEAGRNRTRPRPAGPSVPASTGSSPRTRSACSHSALLTVIAWRGAHGVVGASNCMTEAPRPASSQAATSAATPECSRPTVRPDNDPSDAGVSRLASTVVSSRRFGHFQDPVGYQLVDHGAVKAEQITGDVAGV